LAKPNKVDTNKVQKCYYCGKPIESFDDLVIKKFPMATKAGIRQYNRKLHTDCLLKYSEEVKDAELKRAENDDWEQVYNYFRKEILGLSETQPLDQHTIRRLLGLRLGMYYPQGQNTRILPRGYDFKTILITLKVVKAKVLQYTSKANFVNNKHKIDAIMKIVTGEINDVYKRMETQRKANEKLKQDVVTEIFDYKAKLKEQKKRDKESNKDDISNDINDLFGGLL
jgi:hypothetical protein